MPGLSKLFYLRLYGGDEMSNWKNRKDIVGYKNNT